MNVLLSHPIVLSSLRAVSCKWAVAKDDLDNEKRHGEREREREREREFASSNFPGWFYLPEVTKAWGADTETAGVCMGFGQVSCQF